MENKRATIEFSVEKNAFFEKFTRGKIGKEYSDFICSEEIKTYLKEGINEWATPFIDEFVNIDMRDVFRNMITFDKVYFCMASMIFAKALEEWMSNGGSLDNIILSKFTKEEMADNVNVFKKGFKKLVSQMIKDYQPTIVDDIDEKDSIYVMPKTKASKVLN